MPMKYGFGAAEATRAPGMFHGIIFIVYMAMVASLAAEAGWKKRTTAYGYLAGVVPFGTLFFEWHLKKIGK